MFDVSRILQSREFTLTFHSGKRFERTPDWIRGIKRLERFEPTSVHAMVGARYRVSLRVLFFVSDLEHRH